jgi:hypothetical protein
LIRFATRYPHSSFVTFSNSIHLACDDFPNDQANMNRSRSHLSEVEQLVRRDGTHDLAELCLREFATDADACMVQSDPRIS